jgi:hypothetical protein
MKSECYKFKDAADKLGMTHRQLATAIKNGELELPYIKTGPGTQCYRFPKKAIDDFVAGKRPKKKFSWEREQPDSRVKWLPGEYTRWPQLNVPNDLHERFETVHKNMEAYFGERILKDDLRRIALKEFLDRRPEYAKEENGSRDNATFGEIPGAGETGS